MEVEFFWLRNLDKESGHADRTTTDLSATYATGKGSKNIEKRVVGVNSQDKVAHLGQELLKEELLLNSSSLSFVTATLSTSSASAS